MAQGKLSRSSRKRVDRIMDMVHRVQTDSFKIHEAQIAELVRRDAIPSRPDGYPADSMPEHSSGGSHGDKTLATVLAREQHRTDELRRQLKHIEDLAKWASVSTSELVNTVNYENVKVDREKGRQGTTPCSICLELPAAKSGWCNKCYGEWWDYGSPSRSLWEMFRRGDGVKIEHTEVLRVPDCPPPGDGCTARRGPFANKKQPNEG